MCGPSSFYLGHATLKNFNVMYCNVIALLIADALLLLLLGILFCALLPEEVTIGLFVRDFLLPFCPSYPQTFPLMGVVTPLGFRQTDMSL